MIQSLKFLYQLQYNKKYPIFAIIRFFEWKFIKLFKLTNYKKRVWGDRYLILNYDSFQSMWVMYNWIVDWEEFHLIQDYVMDGDVVIDIGSNMGFYTIWMSKFIGKTGVIHSFEPDPKNFNRLRGNIAVNKLDAQVFANEVALNDYDGIIKFTTGLDGENHISKHEETNINEIQCIKLDSYFQLRAITKISYIKIDVEGFEYSVLAGASNLLRDKKIDILQLEINKAISNSDHTVQGLLQLLQFYNYTLCWYDVISKKLIAIDFEHERENYFAVYDLGIVNNKLKMSVV